jgi:hypothetical protein
MKAYWIQCTKCQQIYWDRFTDRRKRDLVRRMGPIRQPKCGADEWAIFEPAAAVGKEEETLLQNVPVF